MWPGPAVSISWSARGRSLIQVAAEGRLVAELDPQRPDYWDQDDHALLDPFTGDLPLGDDAPDAAGGLPALISPICSRCGRPATVRPAACDPRENAAERVGSHPPVTSFSSAAA